MKTIGMLGGMSWESTTSYYQAVNEGIKEKLGGFHSAEICMYSVDFADIEELQRQGNWQAAGEALGRAAQRVEAGGADFLVICTNTMHKVVPDIEKAVSIPVLHIADATAEKLLADKIKRVGLLGTRFTMEQDFYKGRLAEKFGIEVLIPEPEEREIIHNVIYSELCLGKVKERSRRQYLQIIDALRQRGAEAVILGCTEIALLVRQEDTPVRLYDTTALHAEKAVELAMAEEAQARDEP
jgi:aspartate racemase